MTPAPTRPVSTARSIAQANFEQQSVGDEHALIRANLPPVDELAVNGAHYIGFVSLSARMSPVYGTQTAEPIYHSLSDATRSPDLSAFGVERVLLPNGTFHRRAATDRHTFRYVGDDIVSDALAADGATVLYSTTFDAWSAPIALVGAIQDATVLRSYYSVFSRTNDASFDFSRSWQANSNYSTRSGYRTEDVYFFEDGSTASDGAIPSAINTTATTVSGFFASTTSVKLAGTYTVRGAIYSYADGVEINYGPAKVWIATNTIPNDLNFHVMLVALDGKIYKGLAQMKGVRIRNTDLVSRQVLSTSLRFNGAAARSLKAAVHFTTS